MRYALNNGNWKCARAKGVATEVAVFPASSCISLSLAASWKAGFLPSGPLLWSTALWWVLGSAPSATGAGTAHPYDSEQSHGNISSRISGRKQESFLPSAAKHCWCLFSMRARLRLGLRRKQSCLQVVNLQWVSSLLIHEAQRVFSASHPERRNQLIKQIFASNTRLTYSSWH